MTCLNERKVKEKYKRTTNTKGILEKFKINTIEIPEKHNGDSREILTREIQVIT